MKPLMTKYYIILYLHEYYKVDNVYIIYNIISILFYWYKNKYTSIRGRPLKYNNLHLFIQF